MRVMRFLLKIATFYAASAVLAQSVFAYIDPATGGMIVGSVWPFIIGVLGAIGAFFLRNFYKPIKSNISRIWKKIKRNG
jgi:hypothetical protein